MNFVFCWNAFYFLTARCRTRLECYMCKCCKKRKSHYVGHHWSGKHLFCHKLGHWWRWHYLVIPSNLTRARSKNLGLKSMFEKVTYSNSYLHSYTDGGGGRARWGSVFCPRRRWHTALPPELQPPQVPDTPDIMCNFLWLLKTFRLIMKGKVQHRTTVSHHEYSFISLKWPR